MTVDFWIDPACPWCLITSRWLVEVQGERDLTVRWRPFSLLRKNGDELEERYRRIVEPSHRALRVLAATAEAHGEDAAGRLYTALGTRVHHDGDRELAGLADAVRAAGLDAGLAAAADDAAHDAAIAASMDEALAAAGEDIGVPTIRIGGPGRPAFFGPVLSPAPTGAQALALYDGLVAVTEAGDGALWELKRGRQVSPEMPERPVGL